jgi:glycerol-3-phosphate acyltransferase PlsX
MGGDFAPDAVVKGIAHVSMTTDIECVLVGNAAQIQQLLDRTSYNAELIDIHHAPDVIGMAEDPKEAVRRHPEASLVVAATLVEKGRAAAMVSAGNTGAAILVCARHFPLIPGVRKTGLASVYPRQIDYQGQDPFALLLDVGATIRCESTELVQFALMGSAYAKRISKSTAPRVGLLNMGREDNKGGDALVEAHRRLMAMSEINFVGNIEGHEIPTGRADVVVCEGLLGNVVLKLLEGLGEVVGDLASTAAQQNWRWRLGLAMLSGGVGRLRELTDYATYGGAPILGFQNIFIKAHGRSTERAIGNAVKVAAKAVRDEVAQEIATVIGHLR